MGRRVEPRTQLKNMVDGAHACLAGEDKSSLTTSLTSYGAGARRTTLLRRRLLPEPRRRRPRLGRLADLGQKVTGKPVQPEQFMTLRQAGGRGLEGRITDAVTSTTWGCHCPGRHRLHLRAAPFASSAPENAVKGSASLRQMAHLTQQVGLARTGAPGTYAELSLIHI